MNTLVDKIINTLFVSDENDEFQIMKGMIQRYATEGKFRPITVTAVTDEATAKAALAVIKEHSNRMTFMRTDYNFCGVNNHTPKEDQIVLIDPKFDALVDVEVMASAFNMDKADFIGRRILIDDFGGLSNVLCAVVDREWFMCFDRLISSEQVYNPRGLYYNHFLHHHGVYSCSPFENAVLFVTAAQTVTAIDIFTPTGATSATAAAKETIQLVTVATGTNIPYAKCTWTSSDDDVATVNSMGTVYVKTTDEVTITATSLYNGAVSKTFVINED